jgi:hypothetical protein
MTVKELRAGSDSIDSDSNPGPAANLNRSPDCPSDQKAHARKTLAFSPLTVSLKI